VVVHESSFFGARPSGSRVILYYKEHRIDNRRIKSLRQNIHLSIHMSIYKQIINEMIIKFLALEIYI
jgi:hypothetical protein